MDIAITKMSSKGQIVIPAEMREDIKEGEKLLIIRDKTHIMLRKASDMDERLKEDLEFARRTEEAWKEYDKGKFRSTSVKQFLKEMEKW